MVKLTGARKPKVRGKESEIPWVDFSSGEKECWRGPNSPSEL